eukprot:TRINITY_DN329_c0_g1_i2.p2 TRINITY_DN329_c0_g1~~TRINITY_DN329_c0_g1_i2.p2  ORF type:complete len:285 (+),score=82.85 TRINITY_DN329_c0_g1_i2:443-1297(+)
MSSSDDRKRREPPSGEEGPSTKKPSTNNDVDEITLAYQNRAMIIRLKEKDNEIKTQQEKVQELEDKIGRYEGAVSMIDRYVNQMLESASLILVRIDPNLQMDEVLPPKVDDNCVTTPSLLQALYQHPEPLFEDSDSNVTRVDQIIGDKGTRTLTILERIAEAVEKERTYSHRIAQAIMARGEDFSKSGMAVLVEDNDRLRKEVDRGIQLVDGLQEQHKKICLQVDFLNDQNNQLQNALDIVQNELDKVRDELDVERRKVIKLKDVPTTGIHADLKFPVLSSNVN